MSIGTVASDARMAATEIDKAWKVAHDAPPPTELDGFDERIIRLANLCRELQRRQGNHAFVLRCRTAARLIGVDHLTAWRWLKGLEALGLLELVQHGTGRKANEYRYLGD